MRFRSLSAEDDGVFQALEFEGVHARPPLRLELAQPRALRLTGSEGPIFWARIEDWWESWARLLNPRVAPPPVVPPVRTREIRRLGGEAGTDDWWRAWARYFATALAASADSPLYRATWRLEPVRAPPRSRPWWDPSPPPPANWRAVLQELGAHEEEPLQGNVVIPLRKPAPPGDDRVKALRKLARAGTLPPALLWYLPAGLDVFLVLDGHDRLQAAALEHRAPHLLVLSHSSTIRHGTADEQRTAAMMRGLQQALDSPGTRTRNVTQINAMLIDAHRDSHRRISTRAWALPGGFRAWEKQVRAAGEEAGLVPEVLGLLGPRPR